MIVTVDTVLLVLVWIAVVALYLALWVVLRELRRLRAEMARLTRQPPESGADLLEAAITLPTSVTTAAPRLVLSAESGCPLCRVVLTRLGERVDTLPTPPVLLTHEPAAAWDEVPTGVQMVRDEDAWREAEHLTPPALMLVTPDGAVTDVVLPTREADVDTALKRWGHHCR